MSLKSKALYLAMLLTVIGASLVTWTASANTGGHLVSAVEHTLIKGNQLKAYENEIKIHGMEGAIVCSSAGGEGTMTTATVTELTVISYWSLCETKGGPKVLISENGCSGVATIAPGDPATTEQTADLVCPLPKGIEIEHPNCRMSIPPQNNIGSGTALRITENGKHAIKAVAQAEFKVNFHEGICIFLGTSHTGTAVGSALIKGFNTAGEQVSITTT